MAVDPLIRDILDKMLTAWDAEQRDPAWSDAFYWPSDDFDAEGEASTREPLDFGNVSVYNLS